VQVASPSSAPSIAVSTAATLAPIPSGIHLVTVPPLKPSLIAVLPPLVFQVHGQYLLYKTSVNLPNDTRPTRTFMGVDPEWGRANLRAALGLRPPGRRRVH
jgi:hypothetical protein